MAVPKNKTSHARKSSRRSTVWKINAPELTACPNCGELTAAHKACTKLWYVQRQTGCCKERRTVIFITNITGGSYLFALLFCKFYRISKNNLQTC